MPSASPRRRCRTRAPSTNPSSSHASLGTACASDPGRPGCAAGCLPAERQPRSRPANHGSAAMAVTPMIRRRVWCSSRSSTDRTPAPGARSRTGSRSRPATRSVLVRLPHVLFGTPTRNSARRPRTAPRSPVRSSCGSASRSTSGLPWCGLRPARSPTRHRWPVGLGDRRAPGSAVAHDEELHRRAPAARPLVTLAGPVPSLSPRARPHPGRHRRVRAPRPTGDERALVRAREGRSGPCRACGGPTTLRDRSTRTAMRLWSMNSTNGFISSVYGPL